MWFLFSSAVNVILFLATSVSTVPFACYVDNGTLIIQCNPKYMAKSGCSGDSQSYIRFANCSISNLPRVSPGMSYTIDISNLGGETMMSDIFSDQYNLEKLLAKNNELETLPKNVFSNTKLNYLDFSNNRIARIETIGKSGAKNLQTLLLSNNHIESINATTFNDLRNLTVLDLSFNDLWYLAHESFDQLINLKNLSLAYVRLYHFSFGMLAGCHQLESLNISGNRISNIDIGLHSTLFRNLRRMDLNSNRINAMDGMKLRIFPSLIYLNLQNNNFACSKLVSMLREFDADKLILEVDRTIKIISGPTVRGISCTVPEATTMMNYTSSPPAPAYPYGFYGVMPNFPQFDPIKKYLSAEHIKMENEDLSAPEQPMNLKNVYIVQQKMHELMTVVLILSIIIVTLIILIISGLILSTKQQPFSRFGQNRLLRPFSRRLKDNVQQEAIVL